MRVKVFLFLFLFFSASCLLAASGGGGGAPNWNDLWFKIANFALLLLFLHLAASKSLKAFLRNALNKSADEFEVSAEKLKKAEQDYKELQLKIKQLDAELEKMKASSTVAAEEEKNKIIRDAESFAEKLVEQTESKIRQKYSRAEQEIRSFLIEQSIAKASEKSNLDKIDQKKIIEKFNLDIKEEI